MSDEEAGIEPTEATLQESDTIAQNQLLKPSHSEKTAIKN
jgi:hypothetical protein